MGASGWDYVEPYEGDPSQSLTRLRNRVLAESDYYWDDDYLGPRPASLDELDQLREEEEFWEVGTHSVLDVDRVIAADDEDHDGTVRELPEDEAISIFGTAEPTRDLFIARRNELPNHRQWSGLYQLLHRDGAPTEIAFWGISGD